MLSLLILVFGLLIVGCYWWSTRTNEMTWFRRSNAFLGPILIVLLILNGSATAIVVPACFAIVEWRYMLKNRRSKRNSLDEIAVSDAQA
jgi:hypothetical protein